MITEKPRKTFIIMSLIAVIFEAFWLIYTIPRQVRIGGIPYPNPLLTYIGDTSWGIIAPRIYAAIIAFAVQSIILFLILVFTYRASRLLSGELKLTLLNFQYFTLTLLIASILLTIGHAVFAYLKISIILNDPLGMIYASTMLYSMAMGALAPYFLLNFGYLYARKEKLSEEIAQGVLGVILLIWIIMSSPYNWYAMYPPTLKELDIRPLTNGLILLLNVIVIAKLMVLFRRKIKAETDTIKKIRLKTILVGLIFYLLFFIWFVLEELIKQKFLWSYFVAYGLSSVGVFLMYLGLIAPKFYMSIVEKRLEEKS